MTVRQRVRRALGRRRSRRPRVSVVLPVYDVEDYLAECLDSVLAQQPLLLEVLVVDDGSTDASAAIAAEYAERHPAVRLISQANAGLGAARNNGARHAQGELLAFVDSDDLVLPGAYEAMALALDESGSDFVVGAFVRNFSGQEEPSMPPRQRVLHRERRLGLTVDDFPEVLGDVFAWNKLFRRGFWERAELAWPEGVRYEDQPALTKAYLKATSFDVIRRPVYFWRIREDGTSITQRRSEMEDLRDRFQTKRDSLETVRRLASPEVLRSFYLDGLVMDMPVYFSVIPGCPDEYWDMLHREMRQLWDGAPSFAGATVAPVHRLLAWLVFEGRREQAEEVASFAERHRPLDVPAQNRGDHMVVELPYWDDPASGIPPELYRLQEHERVVRLQRADVASASGTPSS